MLYYCYFIILYKYKFKEYFKDTAVNFFLQNSKEKINLLFKL